MSDRPPRPRAFRLDDAADRGRRRARAARARPPSSARARTDPALDERRRRDRRGGTRGRGRAEVGASQPRPLSLGGLLWTGIGGLVSLALGLWTTNLIEGLFAEAGSLGIVGLVFAVLFALGADRPRAREMIAVARQTRIAEMHVAFAEARAADDRDAARRFVGRSSRSIATGPRRRAPAPKSTEAAARHHRRTRPHRRRRTRAPAARSTRRRKAESPRRPSACRS